MKSFLTSWLPAILFLAITQFHCAHGQTKSVIEEYLKSSEYNEHRKTCESVHESLVDGELNDLLRSFFSDSVKGESNRKEIEKLLNSELFIRHSARIDTHLHVFPSNDRFVTQTVFRDISYLGNNTFLRHRIEVSLIWNSGNYGIESKVIHYDTLNVKSRKNWGRGPWDDLTYDEFLRKLETK